MAFPINIEALLRAQTVESPRSYFLKLLNLTEGQGTGCPTIYARPLNNTPSTSLFSGFGFGRVREYTPCTLTLRALYPEHSSKSRSSRLRRDDQSPFFKDLYVALEANGSPAPHFETDEEASYFLAILYARLPEDKDLKSEHNDSNSGHKAPNSGHKGPNSTDKNPNSTDKNPNSTDKDPNSTDKDPNSADKGTESRANELEILKARLGERSANRDLMELAILYACSLRPIEVKEMGHFLGRNDRYLYDSYVRPLLREGLIKMFYKGRNHPSQRYTLTSEGEKELNRRRKDHSLNDEKEGEV